MCCHKGVYLLQRKTLGNKADVNEKAGGIASRKGPDLGELRGTIVSLEGKKTETTHGKEKGQ